MGKGNSALVVTNENLFRALACTPIAALSWLLAVNVISSSALVLFQVIFVLMALYFTLTTLAYAAYYTNQRFDKSAEAFIKNSNLAKAITFAPLAILSSFVVYHAILSSAHMFFKIIFVLMALYCVLSAIAYAALYTNDYFAEQSEQQFGH